MKVFLDDIRPVPEGWTGCRWPEEVIALLKTGKVQALSLDHDLGHPRRTGMMVLDWLEAQVHEDPDFRVPPITLHTANPVGRQNMMRVLLRLQTRPK